MRPISNALGISLLLLSACRTAPPPAASPAAPASAENAVAADPSERLVAAWRRAAQGDADGALRLFRELDAAGWDVPPEPADFPALEANAEFAEIRARIAARAPRTTLSDVAATIREEGLVAEGIAADPRDGALFVGSIAKRKIVRVAASGGAGDFAAGEASGLGEVLGVKVDPARSLLWAVSNVKARAGTGDVARSSLLAFDLATGAPRVSVTIEEPKHLLNDLAVAGDGSVFVTDSEAGSVLRLPPNGDRLVPIREGGFRYPNGLAIVDGVLLVCDALGLWALDREGAAPRPLLAPGGFPLGGIDGLSARGRTLVGVQNSLGAPRIVRFELAPSARAVLRAEVLEAGNPLWRIPTTGAFRGNEYLYIGNSCLDARRDGELTAEGRVATRLHRLKIPS
ncbi:MAG: SMP-30/gluconolactonase/LRE family protein [Thermoanaerobaculia bacterium]